MTDLTINTDAMKTVVAKAILDSLEPQQREQMITAAIEYLITEPERKDHYGRSEKMPSPLQNAFNDAVARSARSVVEDVLGEPGVQARIDAAIREAVAKAIADHGDLARSIGFAMGDVIEKRIKEWA